MGSFLNFPAELVSVLKGAGELEWVFNPQNRAFHVINYAHTISSLI